MKYSFFLFLFFCQISIAKEIPVFVGDSKVIIKSMQNGRGKFFIHLHKNETTALSVAKALIEKEGGQVITLLHKGGRNIVFRQNGIRYEFDPNRIFTDNGIKNSLSQYSHYSTSAHNQVKKLAQAIIAQIPRGKVIAVHNNKSYSLKNYIHQNSMKSEAQAVFLNPKKYYRNFYLVTQKNDFKRLKAMGFNDVLQSQTPSDDGSLSVFLANRQYINVEAGYNQFKEQFKMLENA